MTIQQANPNAAYVKERNYHLANAEAYANAATVLPRGSEGFCAEWNRHFLARMEALMPITRRLAA